MVSTANSYTTPGEYAYADEVGPTIYMDVYPPLASHMPPRGGGWDRTASYWRRQLLYLLFDDSASMEGQKAAAATEGGRDLIHTCKMKSNGDSIFDVSINWFGEHVFTRPDLLLKPVLEIDEDTIAFAGKSGGTRIKRAMQVCANHIKEYDEKNLSLNAEKERVPAPVIVLMSDGKNGDGDPLPIAKQLTSTPLSIGIPPILITVGIEFDGGEPDVELLTAMASETESGEKLYFDISSAGQLVECLAVAGSTGASTPDEVMRAVVESQTWQKRLPKPGA